MPDIIAKLTIRTKLLLVAHAAAMWLTMYVLKVETRLGRAAVNGVKLDLEGVVE